MDPSAAHLQHHQPSGVIDEEARSSKYIGVSWHHKAKQWRCTIKHQGKKVFLGAFADEVDAARAFDIAAIKYRGASARTNFPVSDYGNINQLIAEGLAESAQPIKRPRGRPKKENTDLHDPNRPLNVVVYQDQAYNPSYFGGQPVQSHQAPVPLPALGPALVHQQHYASQIPYATTTAPSSTVKKEPILPYSPALELVQNTIAEVMGKPLTAFMDLDPYVNHEELLKKQEKAMEWVKQKHLVVVQAPPPPTPPTPATPVSAGKSQVPSQTPTKPGLTPAKRPLSGGVNESVNKTPKSSVPGQKRKFKGVNWVQEKGKWRAQLGLREGKKLHIGYFGNEEQAARAYDRAAIEHHGSSVSTNFPSSDYFPNAQGIIVANMQHYPQTAEPRKKAVAAQTAAQNLHSQQHLGQVPIGQHADQTSKRGPGRPKGSTNRPKSELEGQSAAVRTPIIPAPPRPPQQLPLPGLPRPHLPQPRAPLPPPQPQAHSQGLQQPQAHSQGMLQPQPHSQVIPQPQPHSQVIPQPQAHSHGIPQLPAHTAVSPQRPQPQAPKVSPAKGTVAPKADGKIVHGQQQTQAAQAGQQTGQGNSGSADLVKLKWLGVYWIPKTGRYRAMTSEMVNGNKRKVRIGEFDTEELAARAYDKYVIQIRGSAAKTNYPRVEYQGEVTAPQHQTEKDDSQVTADAAPEQDYHEYQSQGGHYQQYQTYVTQEPVHAQPLPSRLGQNTQSAFTQVASRPSSQSVAPQAAVPTAASTLPQGTSVAYIVAPSVHGYSTGQDTAHAAQYYGVQSTAAPGSAYPTATSTVYTVGGNPYANVVQSTGAVAAPGTYDARGGYQQPWGSAYWPR